MKRFRLPTKLALAIVPIGLVALVAGGLVSWTFLEEARGEERASSAAQVAADAMEALVAVSAERSAMLDAAIGESTAAVEATRARSDRAIESLRETVRDLVPRAAGPASGIASTIFSHSSLSQARLEDARQSDPLSEETQVLFDEIGNRLITVASQATLYFGDAGPAREGAGAVSLARASLASFQQEQLLTRFTADESLVAPEEFEQRFAALESTVVDWLNNADANSPTARALGLARSQVQEGGATPDPDTFLFDRDETLAGAASEILGRVAGAADRAATTVRNEAATVAAVVLGVLLVTAIMALVLGRSTVRRVRSVTAAAQHVADVELPKLVDALSNSKGQLEGTIPVAIEQGGPDEVGELARSFGSLHGTLVEVANRQMDILRRGVSEIFVTLARRNGSLVDRQLALIDELESRQEDPEILEGYYKLDHLSTRMRRNAESLLVLAGSESPRMWSDPLEMGDVVRAALGEVDEYQRVDVLAVEPARLKGRVVTDLAHLISELLDNATQFSPPSERVRVTGLFDDEGYVITIADSGLGISEERLAEINRLIVDPPVLGLALEPTLGMYVVARLAARHNISVRLVPGVPGTTVRVTLRRDLLETAADKQTASPGHLSPDEAPDNGASPKSKIADLPSHAFLGGPTAPAQTGNGSNRPTEPAPSPAVEAAGPSDETAGGVTEAIRTGSHSDIQPDSEGEVAGEGSEETENEQKAAGSTHSSQRPDPSSAPSQPPASPRPESTATASPTVPQRPTPGPATSHTDGPTSPGRTPPPSPPPRPAHERSVTARPTPSTVSRPVDRPDEGSASRPAARTGSLPTRTPGSTFQEDVSTDETSSVSQRGAEGIRSALDGYRMGRDIASQPTKNDGESVSDPDGSQEGRDR